MLDKICINTVFDKKLDESLFSKDFQYEDYLKQSEYDDETGELLKEGYEVKRFKYKSNYSREDLFFTYYLGTKKFRIKGKLHSILEEKSLVKNFSDYSKEKQEEIIQKVNEKSYELLGIKLDIRDFKVTLVETCFNIYNVEHHEKYIEMFNFIFKSKNNENYKNHVLEEIKKHESKKAFVTENNYIEDDEEKYIKISEDSSYYVKSKSSYENNLKDTYAVNFYNKKNQLESRGRNSSEAKNLLRMEVQLYFKEIKKYDRNRMFKRYLEDLNFCKEKVIDKYKWFISSDPYLDFYSYNKAKKIVSETDMLTTREKGHLLRTMKSVNNNRKGLNKNQMRTYKEKLNKLGIYEYFIPSSFKINFLESPISLLEKQISEIDYKK